MLIISTKYIPKSEQHAHAHSLLSCALREYGIDYVSGATPMVYGEQGKPALAEHPGVHFNISHADGISAVVVSENECGIDCEPVRRHNPRVAERVCSESEQAMLKAASESERDLLFFRLWTLKEAYVKALGKGLSFPMREAEFAFDDDRIKTEISGCMFSQYIIDNELVAAVCVFLKTEELNRLCYINAPENKLIKKKYTNSLA
ncbi:MAG: 4'-phosphopantetheinyl transferase superfamily protein [Oscillospiraceae bacterium]|nr:4'-phosphopantetheinyl transferase superfamily protein [Oscillospiraceae bacterium]